MRALSEHHRGDAVVLCDNDVAFSAYIRDGDVNGIRSRPDDMDVPDLGRKDMIRIAKQLEGNAIFLRDVLDL